MSTYLRFSNRDVVSVAVTPLYRGVYPMNISEISTVNAFFAPFHATKTAAKADPAMKTLGAAGCPFTAYSLASNYINADMDFSGISAGLYSSWIRVTMNDGTQYDLPEPEMITLEVY